MRVQTGILLFVISTMALAGDAPLTYADARKIWKASKAKKTYQTYASEFSQFNNHFHLDEKDGCYALPGGHVELMLVITHRDKHEFALIEDVLVDSDNPKAQCFKRTYRGLRTKVPPFFPFALQMGMG
jgi:hypothetical protein